MKPMPMPINANTSTNSNSISNSNVDSNANCLEFGDQQSCYQQAPLCSGGSKNLDELEKSPPVWAMDGLILVV
jgi:hypothetical protein